MLKKVFGLLSVLTFAVVLPAAADTTVRCDSNDGHFHECVAGAADSVTVARPWSKTKCVRGSDDGHRRHCSADTSGGVKIIRRLSKSDCEYKKDWGTDENGVWVSHGCRAEFQVKSRSGLVAQRDRKSG